MFFRLVGTAGTPVWEGWGGWFLIFYDYNKNPISEEFLGVKCLSLCKSGVNIGVSCQNLLPSPVSLICLLYCTTFVIISPLSNKSYPTFLYLPYFIIPALLHNTLLCNKIYIKLIYSKFASQNILWRCGL